MEEMAADEDAEISLCERMREIRILLLHMAGASLSRISFVTEEEDRSSIESRFELC